MLNTVMPDKIEMYWPVIKWSLIESVPPTVGESEDFLNNILRSLLDGSMLAWVAWDWADDEQEKVTLYAVSVTQILREKLSDVKTILIYSIFGFRHIPNEIWVDAFTTLSKYGLANGCSRVACYTKNPQIVKLARMFGGQESSYINFIL